MNYVKQNHMLKIFKALANANRLKILRLINSSENKFLAVSEIAKGLDMAQTLVSEHLKLMRLSKIVRAKQDGSNMYYSICDGMVEDLINKLQ